MLTAAELYRMCAALDVVLKTCIARRQALKPKEAEFLRPDLEKLRQDLGAAAEKRGQGR